MNKIILGDCLEKLKDLEDNSVDSIVTDPPYHLVSIVKRFGKEDSAPAKFGTDGAFSRASKGFMGKQWDGVNEDGIGIAQNPELWKECLRVLKPGGHLLAFSGTRTYHRMASAIEDAGFEVRDMIEWVYGSGFPKSLNIGKAVDRLGGQSLSWFIDYILKVADEKGISRKELTMLFPSKNGNPTGWLWNKQKTQGITLEQYHKIKEFLQLPFADITECEREIVGRGKAGLTAGTIANFTGEKEFDLTKGTSEWEGWGTALKPAHEPICMARKPLAEKTVAENVLKYGTGGINIDTSRVSTDLPEYDDNNACKDLYHKDAQKTHKQNTDHQGESASSPLQQNDHLSNDEKDARNLKSLQDFQSYCLVCSHPYDEHLHYEAKDDLNVSPLLCDAHGLPFRPLTLPDNPLLKSNSYSNNINIDIQSQGRFPANLIHDNSEEVRECFPETKTGAVTKKAESINSEYAFSYNMITHTKERPSDSGNASRFFKSIIYQAKASKSERNKGCEGLEVKGRQGKMMHKANNTSDEVSEGFERFDTQPSANNHPTVKPIALMEYLIKMVTPKGGIVLDPFAGSGSTLVAAKQNGYQYIGIEMTEEYIPIIEARLK